MTGPGDLEGDIVRGGDGNDRIRTRDGEQDIVSCGPGFDVARLDTVDVIEGASTTAPDGDCERVLRADPRPGEDLEERAPEPFLSHLSVGSPPRGVGNQACTSESAPSSSSSSC